MSNSTQQEVIDGAFDRAEGREQELADLAASAALALAWAEWLGVWLRLLCRAAAAELSDGNLTAGDLADMDRPSRRLVAEWRAAPITIDRQRVATVAIDGVLDNLSINGEHAIFFRKRLHELIHRVMPELGRTSLVIDFISYGEKT